MPKIFLSYAHEDFGMAKKVFKDLKRFGLEIWFDSVSLLPGQNWKEEIEKAIKDSTYFIMLLSKHSTARRGFVQNELKFAYEVLDQCPEGDIFMLPVRLEECEPSITIKALHWVDLFPESEYLNGIKKILKVISPDIFLLRDKPKDLTNADVVQLIRAHDFYEHTKNPEGIGFSHKYQKKVIRKQVVIYDEATNLFWQQSGSQYAMEAYEIGRYIESINQEGFAGFFDWRLPTLEEAMSLVEPKPNKSNLNIDDLFNSTQVQIWTSDTLEGKNWTWITDFNFGKCYHSFDRFKKNWTRLKRSEK